MRRGLLFRDSSGRKYECPEIERGNPQGGKAPSSEREARRERREGLERKRMEPRPLRCATQKKRRIEGAALRSRERVPDRGGKADKKNDFASATPYENGEISRKGDNALVLRLGARGLKRI